MANPHTLQADRYARAHYLEKRFCSFINETFPGWFALWTPRESLNKPDYGDFILSFETIDKNKNPLLYTVRCDLKEKPEWDNPPGLPHYWNSVYLAQDGRLHEDWWYFCVSKHFTHYLFYKPSEIPLDVRTINHHAHVVNKFDQTATGVPLDWTTPKPIPPKFHIENPETLPPKNF